MHDFCFTIPYGIAVLLGGIFGYLRKGSTMSLLGGAGSGLLLLLAGFQSWGAYEKGTNDWVALVLETVVSVVLTFVMGQRYMLTGKFMPAGMVLALGIAFSPTEEEALGLDFSSLRWELGFSHRGIMSLFYIYKLATGGNKITKKAT